MDKETKYYVDIVASSLERTIKRLYVVIILLIVLLVGTNAMWVWYESQFEDLVVTQENEDGFNNYIGDDGSIRNLVGVDYGEADD